MKLLMCQCEQCKLGRDCKSTHYNIRHKKSSYRSRVKRMLRKGEYEELPEVVPVGYTD